MTMTAVSSTLKRAPRAVLALAAMLGAICAVSVALWAWYGTDVFFEMVRNGWIACF